MRDELIRQGRIDDVTVAVITFANADRLATYRQLLDIDFDVLTDPDRNVYWAYGLGRGRLRDIYRWQTLLQYARLLREGKKLRRPTEDTRQLGGDFVIGADGRLRFAFHPVAPDDRPRASDMIAALGQAEPGPSC